MQPFTKIGITSFGKPFAKNLSLILLGILMMVTFHSPVAQSYPFNPDLEHNDGPCGTTLGISDCRTAYAYLPAVSLNTNPSEEAFIATNHWMSDLPDSRLLKHMSIPGTHDSGASGVGLGGIHVPVCHVQIWSVAQQLAAGVRFFDIRVDETDNGGWEINHGACDLFLSFEQVMAEMNGFLAAHPDEAILMSFQPNDDDGPNFWEVYAGYAAANPRLLLAKSPPSGEPSSPALNNPNPSLGEVRGKILAISKNVDGHYSYLNMDDQNTFEGVNVGEKLQLVLNQINLAVQNPNDEWIVNFASASDPTGEFLIPEDYAFGINPVVYHVANVRGYDTNIGTILFDFPGEGLIYRVIKTNFPCQPSYYKGCDLKLEVDCPGGLGGNSDSDVTIKFYNGSDYLGEVTQDFSFCQDFTLEDVEIRPGASQFVTHIMVDADGDAPLGITDDVRFENVRIKIIDGAEPVVYSWENENTWCFSTDPDCGGQYGRFEIGNPTMLRTSDPGAIPSYLGQQIADNPNISACSDFRFDLDPLPPLPIAICSSITVSLGSNGSVTIDPEMLDGGSIAGEGAGDLSFRASQTTFDCSDLGVNPVLLTVRDEFYQTAQCLSFVIVESEPVANCRDVTVSLGANNTVQVISQQIDGGSSGGCLPPIVLPSTTQYNCSDVGTNIKTLQVTNALGDGPSSCNATVTVLDPEGPVALCKDITVSLDANGNATISVQDIDGGSTDNCGIDDMTISNNSFDESDAGPNSVELVVSDQGGNVNTCTSTVTVEDITPPTAVCMDITVQLDMNGEASISASDVDGGSTDNTGIDRMFLSTDAFGCDDVGSSSTTLTVVDAYSNSASCDAAVTVEDNIAPVAVCQDITLQLDANGSGTVAASDIDGGSNDACGIATTSISDNAFGCPNVGANNVTLTVEDNHGNSASCDATVTVEDNVLPVPICRDITVQLDANGIAGIVAGAVDAGSNDACGIAMISISDNAFGCANVGANNVTLTVEDNHGNSASCDATVTVEDNVPPVPICRDITIQLDANGDAGIVAGDVDDGSNDACGIASTSISNNTFGCADVGGNAITLTVEDNNGNAASCDAIVTVEDNIPPIPVCQDITLQLDANGTGGISPSDIDGGSNDACGIASLNASVTSFSCTDVGANTVTLNVVDNNNNNASCNAIVTVNDTVSPTPICQDITIFLDSTGNAGIIPSDVDNGSNDACGIASLQVDIPTFDCADAYEYLVRGDKVAVTLTVTDVNNNSSTCEALVAVEYNEADEDCDGVDDYCDICPYGDDRYDNNNDGVPDCWGPGFESLIAYSELHPDFKCPNNPNQEKLKICHPQNPDNEPELCISFNALDTHLDHGDVLGPCSGCNEALVIPEFDGPVVQQEQEELTVFPNPASTELNLRIRNFEQGSGEIRVFSSVGQIIWSQKVEDISMDYQTTIELNERFVSGVYFVTLVHPGGVNTEEIIIQR